MTPLTEQERAEALRLAELTEERRRGTTFYEGKDDRIFRLARALLDADQRITDLTQDAADLWRAVKESDRRAEAAEAQLAACREARDYVRSWVPFDALPDRPRDFANVWYEREMKLREIARRALSDGGSEG